MVSLQQELSDLNVFLSNVEQTRYNIIAKSQDALRNARGFGAKESDVLNQQDAQLKNLVNQEQSAKKRLGEISDLITTQENQRQDFTTNTANPISLTPLFLIGAAIVGVLILRR